VELACAITKGELRGNMNIDCQPFMLQRKEVRCYQVISRGLRFVGMDEIRIGRGTERG
jgi:hypothetical protein